jgi:hypothetical protein
VKKKKPCNGGAGEGGLPILKEEQEEQRPADSPVPAAAQLPVARVAGAPGAAGLPAEAGAEGIGALQAAVAPGIEVPAAAQEVQQAQEHEVAVALAAEEDDVATAGEAEVAAEENGPPPPEEAAQLAVDGVRVAAVEAAVEAAAAAPMPTAEETLRAALAAFPARVDLALEGERAGAGMQALLGVEESSEQLSAATWEEEHDWVAPRLQEECRRYGVAGRCRVPQMQATAHHLRTGRARGAWVWRSSLP